MEEHPGSPVPGPETAPLDEEASRTREGQLHEVQQRLVRDARAADLDEHLVHTAVDEAAATFAQAPVQTFVGILVERAVRERLGLRAAPL